MNLIDRFGEFSNEVTNLLESIKLKWLAKDLGFEKVVLKKGMMLAYFINKPQSDYYQSAKFQNIISTLHHNPRLATFKEKLPKSTLRQAKGDGENTVLMLRFENIKSVQNAIEKLKVFSTESHSGQID